MLLATIWAATLRAPVMALYLVQSQDVPVLCLAAIATILCAFWLPRLRLPDRLPATWALLLVALVLVVLLAFGTYRLMGNFPLSRDEHMVLFDMAVFDDGRLAMPIAPGWRPFALALVPKFLLNANQPSGFVSGYLPMNAALRLAFSKISDPVWFNPLLTALGGAALLDIARRMIGPQDRACWVVLLTYGLSAQVLVNAMTDYSLTAHLALNLIWLAAFLRGGKLGHSVAIAAGFIAVGLHQLAFHPIFVAPFLLWRLREGAWRLVLAYGIAYATIILWWVYYPLIVGPLVAGPVGQVSEGDFVSDRVIPLLRNRDPRAVALMALNLLRFFAWQNVALLGLLIAAVPYAVRDRGLPRALLLGIVLWTLFLALVLPDQGRGWGYRYLNGYVGSFALLAGYGYRELEKRIGAQADSMVIVLSAVTLFATMPLLLVETHRFMEPRIAVEQLIARQPGPFVLIDDEVPVSVDGRWADDANDFVRNRPDLSNRPLRFASDQMNAMLLTELCHRGPVTLITRADLRRAGFEPNAPDPSPRFDAPVAGVRQGAFGCFRHAI